MDASVVLTICVLMARQAFTNEMREYIEIMSESGGGGGMEGQVF